MGRNGEKDFRLTLVRRAPGEYVVKVGHHSDHRHRAVPVGQFASNRTLGKELPGRRFVHDRDRLRDRAVRRRRQPAVTHAQPHRLEVPGRTDRIATGVFFPLTETTETVDVLPSAK